MPLLSSRKFRAHSWRVAGVIVLACATTAGAQTTYHLHNEASTTANLKQLKTSAPDVASVAIQTANLRNTANGEKLLKQFDTQAGVPGTAGSIPYGSTITFQLWMRKTASIGTLFPRAKPRLNNPRSARRREPLCHHDDAHDVRCRTTANVKLVAIDGCISGR